MRAELGDFYRRRRAAHPGEKLTQIGGFSKRTLGDAGDRKLRTKAAETWTFLLFLIDRLGVNPKRLGAEDPSLLAAARALQRLVEHWNSCGPTLRPHEIQTSFSLWQQHLRLTAGIEDVHIPKRHLMSHLLGSLTLHGNPRLYANWLDESLNNDLKKCCRLVSQVSFEVMVLLRFRELLHRRGLKRKAS